MQTQQIGIDISADVSFDVTNGAIVLAPPPYRFKGNVVRANVGIYDVTIAAGEGIDLNNAEVDVHYRAAQTLPPGDCLMWTVSQLASTPAGEAVYRVAFTQPQLTAGAGPVIFVATDVSHGSITIRRKVPSVN